MNIHYLGLSEINGPLIFLDHVKEAGFEEMVEIKMSNGSVRHGRVVQVEGEKVDGKKITVPCIVVDS